LSVLPCAQALGGGVPGPDPTDGARFGDSLSDDGSYARDDLPTGWLPLKKKAKRLLRKMLRFAARDSAKSLLPICPPTSTGS
jgi:hypothetical protein